MSPQQNDIAAALREIPVPPTSVTTQHAILLGRKAIRRRNTVAVVAVVAAGAVTASGFALARPAPDRLTISPPSPTHSPSLSPPTVAPAPFPSSFTWTVTPLATVGTGTVTVTSMDSSGRYITGSLIASRGLAVLWDNLVPMLLPQPVDNARDIHAIDVNSSGAVVGNASGAGGSYAWLYRDGFATALPAPEGGGPYVVRDINDRGDILGWSERSGPVLWPASSSGSVRILGLGDAYAIGDDGTVGGTTRDGEHPAVVDPDGTLRRLNEVPGKPGGKVFDVTGDWASGWVTADNDSHWTAALWNLRTGSLIYFSEVASTAVAVSANGAMLAARSGIDPTVLVIPDGRIVDLPNLPGHSTTTTTTAARAISADGAVIAGNQRLANGSSIPVFWKRSP